MKALARVLTHKSVRSSAGTGLRASGAAPASGPAASDNFEGASRASAEMIEGMDSAFKDIVIGDDVRGMLNAQLHRLDDRASQYANSSLDFCEPKELWSCTQQEASRIALAWACAANVYDHGSGSEQLFEHAGAKLSVSWSLPESSLGTSKATTFTTYIPAPEVLATTVSAPYLVIAIRGSATKLDHIVNLNGEPRSAKELFRDDFIAMDAHAGFLNSALKLLPVLSNQIEQRLCENPMTKLLFTGHSAGGATAMLLYLSFRLRIAEKYPETTISCITFGCPPVVKAIHQQGEDALENILAQDHVINIVNEFDFITRADSAYFRSLIQLYQQVDDTPISTIWPLPSHGLQQVGNIVVLRTELPQFEDGVDGRDSPSLGLSAWKVTAGNLAKLMFCRLSVHGRVAYQERIVQLENGIFNKQNSWM